MDLYHLDWQLAMSALGHERSFSIISVERPLSGAYRTFKHLENGKSDRLLSATSGRPAFLLECLLWSTAGALSTGEAENERSILFTNFIQPADVRHRGDQITVTAAAIPR